MRLHDERGQVDAEQHMRKRLAIVAHFVKVDAPELGHGLKKRGYELRMGKFTDHLDRMADELQAIKRVSKK
ncbi:hypothetical protein GCM10009780_13930 [Actinomadura alba]